MKSIKKKNSKKKKELPPVDVNNKEEMIALGIHPRDRFVRDPSVWTKTPEEKALVKEARHRYGRGIGTRLSAS
jgi:hypothetical protein